MKRLIFLLLLSTSFLAAGNDKENNIRKLLELTGSGKIGIQVMNQMISSFKQIKPNVPEEFWAGFMKEIKSDDLVNLIIPIYDKYFTNDEIKQLIEFYNIPVGKKTIKILPQITQESMSVGQEWGKKIGE